MSYWPRAGALCILVSLTCLPQGKGRPPAAVGHLPSQIELATLGRELFFEKRMSLNGTTACASCHRPEFAFADNRRFSIGQRGQPTKRNTPSLLNRPTVGFEFWDGRATSLLNQATSPLEDDEEMANSIEEVCRRLEGIEYYSKKFYVTFGKRRISPERLSHALVAFEETLRSGLSDYERMKESGTLAGSIRRGEELFSGKGKCSTCHLGPNFTDERFHNTGVAWKTSKDLGRGALSGRLEDSRAFKTPTLRELVWTAPYMHDGSLPSLDAAVEHYLTGGAPLDPFLDPIIRPVGLTPDERRDLIAFLRSLSNSQGYFR